MLTLSPLILAYAMQAGSRKTHADGYSFELSAVQKLTDPGPETTITDMPRILSETEPCNDVPAGPCLVEELSTSIRSQLIPGTVALAYKLNVHGPGGFYKSLVDTQTRNSALILGTAVIALPSSCCGGALRVCAVIGGQTVSIGKASFDWGESLQSQSDESKAAGGTEDDASPCSSTALPWAAFFGDCIHDVLPVTSGFRVTLTFRIVADEKWADVPSDGALQASAAGGKVSTGISDSDRLITSNIARVLESIASRPLPAATFGILLSHKYTFGGATVAGLKGVDAALFAALEKAGRYSLTLQPVANCIERRGSAYDRKVTDTVHAFGLPEVDCLNKLPRLPWWERLDPVQTDPSSRNPFVRFFSPEKHVLPDAPPGELLKYDDFSKDDCDDDYVYFSIALVVAPRAV